MKTRFLSSTIERIKNSEFVRNSATLLTANVVSQAIAIAVYPIVTRLYSAEDVGVYSLFLSIVSILNIIATGRYESATVLPKEDRKAAAVFQLCLLINICLFVIILPICLFCKKPVAQLFDAPALAHVLPLLPFVVLTAGLWQAINYLLIREKRYKNISGYQLGQNIVNSGSKCLFGAAGLLQSGLIYATVLGQLSALAGSWVAARKKIGEYLSKPDSAEIKTTAKEYANFPKYELPHAVVNTLAGNLPILILSAYFGMKEIGFLSLGITLGFKPISLVSSSMGQVLYQKCAAAHQQKAPIKPFFSEFVKKITLLTLPVFIILYFCVEWLCGVIFGAEWTEAGFYTKFMLPWFFFVLPTGTLSFIPKIFSKQKDAMLIEFSYITLRIIALAVGIYFNNLLLAIILFSGISAIVVALQLLWYFSLVNRYERQK
ncbi:MAG: oligosaccharide flippase family protein [Bacteroidales bacterium]|nr:oligosaccharide flippase family protein [Bacteroidales bacterium]